jgi:peptide chain release factor subunit 3
MLQNIPIENVNYDNVLDLKKSIALKNKCNIDKINITKKITSNYDFFNTNYINLKNDKIPINIAFIGHVDSGKSTLSGHIMIKTNNFDKHEYEKFLKECNENNNNTQKFSGLLDVCDEERVKGKTMEYAKMSFSTKTHKFTIIDVPGHENYLPNMISGICQADVALLIVSAKCGEFESGFTKNGSTKEHILLAKIFGIKQLIICITKMDIIDWSKERYTYIQQTLQSWLDTCCKFDIVNFVPISGYCGDNINTCNTFTDKCLFDIFDNIQMKTQDFEKLRLPISYKNKDQGYTFIHGKIESGIIHVNTELYLHPLNEKIYVIDLFDINDIPIKYAIVGDNIKIKIKINNDNICNGMIITDIINNFYSFTEFKSTIKTFNLPCGVLSEEFKCIMHLYSGTYNVTLKNINNKKYILSNSVANVTISSDNIICGEKFDDFNKLGIFILRYNNKTIACGKITKIKPINLNEYANSKLTNNTYNNLFIEIPDDCNLSLNNIYSNLHYNVIL